jgi:Mg2+/Co2+ transporter CorC
MTEITIQDITGRIVYHQETATDDKVEIDLKSQPKGMYFIRAKAGEKILNKKLVIQ